MTNLLSCYDIENLEKCDCGSWYFKLYGDDNPDKWPPGMWRDMCEMHQGNFDSSPPRIVMIDRIAQLSLAQKELQAFSGAETHLPAYWLFETFLNGDIPDKGTSSCNVKITDHLHEMYTAAKRSGDSFCSDANFKQVGAPSAPKRDHQKSCM